MEGYDLGNDYLKINVIRIVYLWKDMIQGNDYLKIIHILSSDTLIFHLCI
jgi:hypothetical protein